MSALVHHPTEDAALGRVRPRPLPSAKVLFARRADTRRRGDRYGTVLLGHLIDRAQGVAQ